VLFESAGAVLEQRHDLAADVVAEDAVGRRDALRLVGGRAQPVDEEVEDLHRLLVAELVHRDPDQGEVLGEGLGPGGRVEGPVGQGPDGVGHVVGVRPEEAERVQERLRLLAGDPDGVCQQPDLSSLLADDGGVVGYRRADAGDGRGQDGGGLGRLLHPVAEVLDADIELIELAVVRLHPQFDEQLSDRLGHQRLRLGDWLAIFRRSSSHWSRS